MDPYIGMPESPWAYFIAGMGFAGMLYRHLKWR